MSESVTIDGLTIGVPLRVDFVMSALKCIVLMLVALVYLLNVDAFCFTR